MNVTKKSNSWASSNALHKKGPLTLLPEQMFSSHFESFHSSSGDVSREEAHSFSTEHNQLVQMTAQEKVMGMKRSEVF